MGDEAASDIDDGAQRVTVSLPKEAMEFLRAESNRTGSSMGEIVRRTIANQIFLQSATERGADLLLAEKGKPTNRVVFR